MTTDLKVVEGGTVVPIATPGTELEALRKARRAMAAEIDDKNETIRQLKHQLMIAEAWAGLPNIEDVRAVIARHRSGKMDPWDQNVATALCACEVAAEALSIQQVRAGFDALGIDDPTERLTAWLRDYAALLSVLEPALGEDRHALQ